MNIIDLCDSIATNLTHNLRLATSNGERQRYHYLAMQGIAEKVDPALNQLLADKGEGSPELEQARTVALELAAFVCIGFIRQCSDYKWGISCIEEIAGNCRDLHLKKKLVNYTNQLKQRWNTAEPGGLVHNPRAKHIQPPSTKPNHLRIFLIIVIMFGSTVFFVGHMDLTSLVFPALNFPRQQVDSSGPSEESRPESLTSTTGDISSPLPRAEEPIKQVDPSEGQFYTFTDRQGIVHIVNNLEKVPTEDRGGVKVFRADTSRRLVTPVIIKHDQVLLPVTISLRGKTVEALFLLDTGASVTTISEGLAVRLGVTASEVRGGRTTIADGRTVGSYLFQADSLAVGSRSVTNAQVSIISRSVGQGYEGLLGMNFLKNFRYHLNFDRSVIEWSG